MPRSVENVANQGIIKDLVKAAVASVERQNYLAASIIMFQTVEGLLRLSIKVFGDASGANKETLEKCADKETSFWRLVLHFDMFYPDNGLGKRLLTLNARRNKIMHRLFFEFDSLEHLQQELGAFCKEAMELNISLKETLGLPEDKQRGF